MRRAAFGAGGDTIPVIGQGTWYLEREPEAVRRLQQGIDLGMTHIDTAEMYGSGAAEKVVGRAIAGRREEIFLVSKVLPGNASRAGTIEACEDSLGRLGTDYLDVYLLHWPGHHPLEDTMEAFQALRREGKIRAFGVSNFDVDDLEALAGVIDPSQIACNQVLYGPAERTIENEVLPWCRARGIPVVAYSPFGHGALPGSETPAGRLLAGVGARHGVSAHQVALAFVTRQPDVFAIPKAARAEHVADNAAAGDLVLGPDDIEALETGLPGTPAGTPLPIL